MSFNRFSLLDVDGDSDAPETPQILRDNDDNDNEEIELGEIRDDIRDEAEVHVDHLNHRSAQGALRQFFRILIDI